MRRGAIINRVGTARHDLVHLHTEPPPQPGAERRRAVVEVAARG